MKRFKVGDTVFIAGRIGEYYQPLVKGTVLKSFDASNGFFYDVSSYGDIKETRVYETKLAALSNLKEEAEKWLNFLNSLGDEMAEKK